jgi:glycosyltransferase involved in cell wall biosynthesis
MKAIIYSFRHEYYLSGQFRATNQMRELFHELGWETETCYEDHNHLHNGSTFNFQLLFRNIDRLLFGIKILNQIEANLVIIRIPCFSQTFFVDWLYRKLNKPFIILVESMAWNKTNRGSFSREVYYEPILAISKRIINHPLWGSIANNHPKTFIASSKAQLEQVKKYIGPKHDYHHIENSFFEPLEKPPIRSNFDPKKVKLGYIGHDYIYKGVIEIANSVTLVKKEISQVELTGAFSGMGLGKAQKIWKNAGGTVLQEVDRDEFYDSLDILCYPLYEDYGSQVYALVILEAMRRGVPMVLSNTAANRELVEPEMIPLIDKVNEKSIAKAVISLHKKNAGEVSDYLRERFKKISRTVVKEKWRKLLENYA